MNIIPIGVCLLLLCLMACSCESVSTKPQANNSDDISVKVTFSVDPECDNFSLTSDECNLVFLITNTSKHPVKMGLPLIFTIIRRQSGIKMHVDYGLLKSIQDIEPNQSVLITGYTLRDFYVDYSDLSVREKNIMDIKLSYRLTYPKLEKKYYKGSFCIDLSPMKFEKGKIYGKVGYKRTNNIDVYILDPKLGIIKHYFGRSNTEWKEWPIMGK